jgi:hypothetical protein
MICWLPLAQEIAATPQTINLRNCAFRSQSPNHNWEQTTMPIFSNETGRTTRLSRIMSGLHSKFHQRFGLSEIMAWSSLYHPINASIQKSNRKFSFKKDYFVVVGSGLSCLSSQKVHKALCCSRRMRSKYRRAVRELPLLHLHGSKCAVLVSETQIFQELAILSGSSNCLMPAQPTLSQT